MPLATRASNSGRASPRPPISLGPALARAADAGVPTQNTTLHACPPSLRTVAAAGYAKNYEKHISTSSRRKKSRKSYIHNSHRRPRETPNDCRTRPALDFSTMPQIGEGGVKLSSRSQDLARPWHTLNIYDTYDGAET